MAEIQRLEAVLSALQKRARNSIRATSVVVGYTAAYAVYVHENLEAYHPVGQAKFLEQPARQLPLGDIVTENVRAGVPFNKALIIAGLRLQRESQQLCPVDTGALRASAFTKEEPISG